MHSICVHFKMLKKIQIGIMMGTFQNQFVKMYLTKKSTNQFISNRLTYQHN